MSEALNALYSAMSSFVGMFFQLSLGDLNISLGNFILAILILGAVIAVVFSAVRSFDFQIRSSRRSDNE